MAMAKDMHGEKHLPMGKWWEDPKVAKKLNLSDADKAKLKEAFDTSHRKLIKLKSAVETERFELGNLLDSEDFNEAALMQQFNKLEKARSELSRERFGFLVEVRKTLGHERYQLLKQERQKYHKSKRHRRKEHPAPPHDEM
jgi:Spy/CpxP family protein refolding chaperone